MTKNNKLFAMMFAALVSTSAAQAWEYADYVPTTLGAVPGYALKGVGALVLLKTAHMVWGKSVPVNEITRAPKTAGYLTRAWGVINHDLFGQMEKPLGYIEKTITDENGKEVKMLEIVEIPATGILGKLASRYKEFALTAGFVLLVNQLLKAVNVTSPAIITDAATSIKQVVSHVK